MRIAIAGPDGAGKSSICNALSEQIKPSAVIYAGKANFRFRSTVWALNIWNKVRKSHQVFSLLVQYFLYYPLEYCEYLSKFHANKRNNTSYIYDRHPIDRVILKHEWLLLRRAEKIGAVNFYIQYPFFWFWGGIYKYFFPNIDDVFVVLPEPDLCFVRSGGQYRDLEEASIKVKAYYLALNELNNSQQYQLLKVDSSVSIESICEQVIEIIRVKKAHHAKN